MKNATTAARIVLGLLFILAGASGFALINNPPPMPGLAGAFQDVFFKSHWVLFVDAVQVVAGVLLLANRFVPVGLMMLAAVIFNILVFHITMMPSGIVPGLIALLLWFVVARQYRSLFAPLFAAQPRIDAERVFHVSQSLSVVQR
jgi:hypothetical protein